MSEANPVTAEESLRQIEEIINAQDPIWQIKPAEALTDIRDFLADILKRVQVLEAQNEHERRREIDW